MRRLGALGLWRACARAPPRRPAAPRCPALPPSLRALRPLGSAPASAAGAGPEPGPAGPAQHIWLCKPGHEARLAAELEAQGFAVPRLEPSSGWVLGEGAPARSPADSTWALQCLPFVTCIRGDPAGHSLRAMHRRAAAAMMAALAGGVGGDERRWCAQAFGPPAAGWPPPAKLHWCRPLRCPRARGPGDCVVAGTVPGRRGSVC